MKLLHDRKRDGSRGAAALELTVAMPLMLMVAFGVIEFGSAFDLRQKLVTVAAEAARIGSQSSCPRATEAEVLAAAHATLASFGLDPALATFTFENTGGESGTEMIVSVSYDAGFQLLSSFMDLATDSDGDIPVTVSFAAENE